MSNLIRVTLDSFEFNEFIGTKSISLLKFIHKLYKKYEQYKKEGHKNIEIYYGSYIDVIEIIAYREETDYEKTERLKKILRQDDDEYQLYLTLKKKFESENIINE